MIARWLSVLSTYDFTIDYRRGSAHNNANALSHYSHRLYKYPLCTDCAKNRTKSTNVSATVSIPTDDLADSKGTVMPVVNQTSLPVLAHSDISRSGEVVDNIDSDQGFWVKGWSDEQIKQWQSQDSCISRIVKLKGNSDKQPPRDIVFGEKGNVKCLWSLWDQFDVQDSTLRYKWHNPANESVQLLLIAPQELRKVIFKKLTVIGQPAILEDVVQ